MEDKRLRKLKRDELLEMLLESEHENEMLAEENQALSARLSEQRTVAALPPDDERPSVEALSAELSNRKNRSRKTRIIRDAVVCLLGVAAATVLLSTLFFPALRIYGASMTPTLEEGEIVVSVAHGQYEAGDVIAFYYNNKLLVKRVICGPGDWFSMRDDGTVLVNGVQLDEPYVQDESFDPCDLELPYQVPDGCFFVMGDHRSTSMDSRLQQVGCVSEDQIVGRIALCLWPLQSLRVIG